MLTYLNRKTNQELIRNIIDKLLSNGITGLYYSVIFNLGEANQRYAFSSRSNIFKK